MNPFEYPPAPHVRKHGPCGYADDASFRPWLRDEFAFRCVFCLRREQWGRVTAEFAIDHFQPVSLKPQLAIEYANLLYACATCNCRKSDRSVPDPTQTLVG